MTTAWQVPQLSSERVLQQLLCFYTAVKNPTINGTVYLFSAALDLAGGIGGVVGELAGNLLGELKERLLRTPVADLVAFFDSIKPLIGDNPYRRCRTAGPGKPTVPKHDGGHSGIGEARITWAKLTAGREA